MLALVVLAGSAGVFVLATLVLGAACLLSRQRLSAAGWGWVALPLAATAAVVVLAG